MHINAMFIYFFNLFLLLPFLSFKCSQWPTYHVCIHRAFSVESIRLIATIDILHIFIIQKWNFYAANDTILCLCLVIISLIFMQPYSKYRISCWVFASANAFQTFKKTEKLNRLGLKFALAASAHIFTSNTIRMRLK